MPIENNPEIEDSSEEETEVKYKKKPVIKKPVVKKPKVNRDINEMKESIKKLENIAISKSNVAKQSFNNKSKIYEQSYSTKRPSKIDTVLNSVQTPPPPPPSAPASISRKKRDQIRKILESDSDSEIEDNSMNHIIQQVQKIEPEPVSPMPRPPPMKPRRRFKFKS